MVLEKLRHYFRMRMPYMEPEIAHRKRTKLALVYAALAWNILGFTVYYTWRKSVPKTNDSVDYAKMLGVKEAKVIKFSGFHKTEEFDLKLGDKDIEEYVDKVSTNNTDQL